MDLPRDSQSYELIHKLSEGPYASVYVARCKINEKLVAVKMVDLDLSPIDMNLLRKGMAFWSTSTHEFIVKYFGSFVSGSKMWNLFEYMDGGSCRDILQYSFQTGFRDEVLIASIFEPVLQFLVYFHENHRIHRDIRSGNILLSSEGDVKVSDLCLSGSLIESGQLSKALFSIVGCKMYMAPEIHGKAGYTEKADLWSVGITALEMAKGYMDQTLFQELIDAFQSKASNPVCFREFSPKFIEFIRLCLTEDPEKRPNAADLLKSPFIKLSKGKKYVYSTLVSNLPPLYQRFELMNPKKCNESPIKDRKIHKFEFVEEDVSDVPKDLEEEEECGTVKQFGRFTMTIRQSRKRLRSSLQV